MMNNTQFEYMANLQYKVKSLTAQVNVFKSGEQYKKLENAHAKILASKNREISRIKRELADVRQKYVDVRKNWQEVIEDMEKEHAREIAEKDRIIAELERQIAKRDEKIADLRQKTKSAVEECYQARTELEDEKNKVKKLTAQINRDFTTSGIPSSQIKHNKKKVTNNRVRTGRKPGGQPGHSGHRRKPQTPTQWRVIPAPEKFLQPEFKETGRQITKQHIEIRMELVVTEFSTPEYRNTITGQRVHANFPEGLVNEVTYGGSVKALAFIVQNQCNVSGKKTTDFIREITGGKLCLSGGLISNLAKEFAEKSKAEQEKAIADLYVSPTMYTDFTGARVNGENKQVLVCSNGKQTMYFAREHKGHEGVKGTPVEHFQNNLVHDHDLTFYNYGGNHQECLAHISRCLKDCVLNDSGRKWYNQMDQLISEMIHFKNGLDPEDARNPDEINPEKVGEFETRYDEIRKLAEEEYDYEPPDMKYFPTGFNLYKRMGKFREYHLLFLHDKTVDPTNNLSERCLRTFKRKQQQVMSFRSFAGFSYFCVALSVIMSFAFEGKNLFESISDIFQPIDPTTA